MTWLIIYIQYDKRGIEVTVTELVSELVFAGSNPVCSIMIAVVIGYLTFNFLAGLFMWRYAMSSIGPSRGFLVVVKREKTGTEIKLPQGLFSGDFERISYDLFDMHNPEFPSEEGWRIGIFSFDEHVYLKSVEEYNNQLC